MNREKLAAQRRLIDGVLHLHRDLVNLAYNAYGMVPARKVDGYWISKPVAHLPVNEPFRHALIQKGIRFGPHASDNVVLQFGIMASIAPTEDGVMFKPDVADYRVEDRDHHWWIFKAALEVFGQELPMVARKIIETGQLMVTWKDVKLPDIRSLRSLFGEFCQERPHAVKLVKSKAFHPNPADENGPYLSAQHQAALFAVWQDQLEDHMVA